MGVCEQSVNSDDKAVAGPSGCSRAELEAKDGSCCKSREKRWKYGTAYFNFLADFREDHKGKRWSPTEIARRAGEAWRRLTNEQKRPYEEAALRNRKNGKGRKRGGHKAAMGRGHKSPKRSGKRGAGKHYRNRSDSDTDTETDSDLSERPVKKRKTSSAMLLTKSKRGQKEKFYDSDESCICGMKTGDGSTAGKGTGAKRTRKQRPLADECEESDSGSHYSSYTDD